MTLDELKEKAYETMQSKRVTITTLCNYLGDNGIASIDLCQQKHVVSDLMENISPLCTNQKSFLTAFGCQTNGLWLLDR